ncbi:MAG: PEP-CTERM sorting domain-containing protein [Akkermansia sp.]|nr:PEP-CTERM sorting domain-containing protein [Akkermansia sp.]
MKKTIIALLSLGCLSFGETTQITELPSDRYAAIGFQGVGDSIVTTLSSGSADLLNSEKKGLHWNNWMMEFQLTDVSLTAGQAITFFKSRGDNNPGTELRLTSDAVSGALTLGFYYNGSAICEGLAFQEGVVYRAAYQYGNAAVDSKKGQTYLTNTETGDFIYDRLTSNQQNGIMGGNNGTITGKMYTNNQLTISVSGGYNFWDLPGSKDEHINTFKAYATLVPEPTTATLSLLALAGLAARRRRK